MSKKKDEALDIIANYILPFYTFNGERFVKLELAEYLRDLARKAVEVKK